MKLEGKLGRHHLKGVPGGAIHAVLCAAGHNLRLILRHLARVLCVLLPLLIADAPIDKTASHSA